MDLKGDVTSLSDYANVISESRGALRVNHILKTVFPIFFFPISDISRNTISSHHCIFFSPSDKKFSHG